MKIKTICLSNLRAALLLLCLAAPAHAERPNLVFRLGVDSLSYNQSAIEGLSGMSLFVVSPRGYYFGESIYSAALGQGGGFFVGGAEFGKTTPIGERFFWDASLFIGGGGGAAQVPGDGLMLRPQVHAGVTFGRMRLGAGVAWTRVSGSEISSPSFGVTLSRQLDLALVSGGGTGGRTEFSQMRVRYRPYIPLGSTKRNGQPLQVMHLIGGEMIFAESEQRETFIVAVGAVAGDAEGYADWQLGQRFLLGQGAFRPYAEAAIGIGGGGAVETGGGLIASIGAGLRWQPGRLGFDLGISAITSINGDFLVVSPTLNIGLAFGGGQSQSTEWQISTGLTQQLPNADFRKAGVSNTGSPLMIDIKIDLFLTPSLYLSGQAYTALAGGAGGYQIGLFGLGYRHKLAPRWSLSGEALVGAGGGAGIDTKGGLLLAYGLDLDYALTERILVTLGAGQIMTMQGGGMAPLTANIGLKLPFTTLH
ncbi:MAG: hypothetical protein COB08_013825 [Rhodobacteraceae bacterium]|nr:hypothetical protein [Paracoccaceae bacterium]